jgi:uncharacterized protein (TIGR03382 family)
MLRSVICFTLLAGSGSLALADSTYNETLIHDTTSSVDIALDANTVLCSSADYGALYLKVGIPQLATLTLLDHQNVGAGAPCVAAGMCTPGHMPTDIIDAAHPTETVQIDVKAFRADEADSTAQTCDTTLIERVHVTIRGFEFTHERSSSLGSRRFADCVTSAAAPGSGDEAKTDSPDSTTTPKSGGCSSTGGGAGSGVLVVVLGAWLRRRRATP